MNWYKRHLGDYAKDTGHLSMVEHGAYTLLLDFYYSSGGTLPDDMQGILRLCRAMNKLEQAAVRSIVAQFFPVGPDGARHNKRADMEIDRANRQREINREVGRLGGRKKTESVTESVSKSDTETTSESVTESVSIREPKKNPSHKPEAISQRKPENHPPTPLAVARGASDEPAAEESTDLLGDAATPKGRRRRPRTEAPSEVSLTDPLYDWANSIGLSDDDVEREAAKFLNHAKATDRRLADWQAGLRNWLLTAVEIRSRVASGRSAA